MWKVSGRNEITDFDEIVRIEGEYIENWSFTAGCKAAFEGDIGGNCQKGGEGRMR